MLLRRFLLEVILRKWQDRLKSIATSGALLANEATRHRKLHQALRSKPLWALCGSIPQEIVAGWSK